MEDILRDKAHRMNQRMLVKSTSPISSKMCKEKKNPLCSFLLRLMLGVLSVCIAFVILSYLVASPPMHWFYKMGDDAGPASIYLPGGGFSGFWFHFGYLDSFSKKHNLYEYDYYCFSAGCMSKSSCTSSWLSY